MTDLRENCINSGRNEDIRRSGSRGNDIQVKQSIVTIIGEAKFRIAAIEREKLKMKKMIIALLIISMLLSLEGCALLDVADYVINGASYEIRYELNGGTLVSGELLQVVKEGEDAVEPEVERDGFMFTAWNSPSTNVTSDQVIIAQWKRLYNVEFDPSGGTLSSGELSQTVPEGEMPAIPSLTMEGMEFEGWTPEIHQTDSDISYTAQWSRLTLSAEELYQRISPSVVEINTYDYDGSWQGLGSGFFIDADGTIATNFHVIEGAYSATISLSNGREYEVVSVLDYDEYVDLALLETNIRGNEFLHAATSAVQTGETVYAIGSSRGFTSSFSDGIVASASREIEGVRYIQTTAPISGGNSGGPLINTFGEVVGINTMSVNNGQNLNFAIDISELEQLDGNGYTTMMDFYQTTNYEFNWMQAAIEFLAPAESAEVESNDSLFLADQLYIGSWTAAALSDKDDIDYFYVSVDTPGYLLFEVVPEFVSNSEIIICGVFQIIDDDMKIVGALDRSSSYEYDVENVLKIDIDEGGVYFLVVAFNDNATFDELPIYMVRVSR